MSSQHTPGPWTAQPTGDRHTPAIVTSAKRETGFTPWVCSIQEVDIDTANATARLIAAAPDLLAACKAAIAQADANMTRFYSGRTPQAQAVYDQVARAITKATQATEGTP